VWYYLRLLSNLKNKGGNNKMLTNTYVGPLFSPIKKRKKIRVKEIFRRFFTFIFYKPQAKVVNGAESDSAKVLPSRILH
jgi:hypothetical protein